VDLEKMKKDTKNDKYTEIFMENVEKVRVESIERKKMDLINRMEMKSVGSGQEEFDNMAI